MSCDGILITSVNNITSLVAHEVITLKLKKTQVAIILHTVHIIHIILIISLSLYEVTVAVPLGLISSEILYKSYNEKD